MNEQETTRCAKTYLDALGRGMDPISGQPAPEDSVLSQARIRRCFQYVSGVLGGHLTPCGAGYICEASLAAWLEGKGAFVQKEGGGGPAYVV